MRVRLSVFRRQRSRYFGYEHSPAGRWVNIWWGSPTHHRWWAASIYLNY